MKEKLAELKSKGNVSLEEQTRSQVQFLRTLFGLPLNTKPDPNPIKKLKGLFKEYGGENMDAAEEVRAVRDNE